MVTKRFFELLFVIGALFSVSNILFAQGIDSLRITVTDSKIPIPVFFKQIEDQYQIIFYYKPEWFSEDTVNRSFNDATLKEALEQIFLDKPYQYEVIQGNMIIFLPKEEIALLNKEMVNKSTREIESADVVVIGNPNEKGKYKIVRVRGMVREGKTGEPVIGATVALQNTGTRVVTDVDGNYSLDVRPGLYSIEVSSLGFEPEIFNVKVISHDKLDVRLFEKSIEISEVSVYGQRADKNIRTAQMGLVEMNSESLKLLPSAVGERDIIKGLTVLPGVKSVGEFGSGINVRGGGEDQNLYLIQGVPLFNTSHVFGLFSVINPDLVNNVTLYKGHIPAEHGERVSSVMDIRVEDNIEKRFGGRVGIGLYSSRLMLTGSVADSKISFKLGGRTSYSDWLLKSIKNYNLQNSSASFYDLNGVMNIKFKNDVFTIFGYSSNDSFKYHSLLAFNYGNRLGSVDWKHFFNNSFFTALTIAHSEYAAVEDDIELPLEHSRSRFKLKYTSGKLNARFIGFKSHTIDMGTKIIGYTIYPGELTPLKADSLVQRLEIAKEQSYEAAVYVNDTYEINEHFTLNAGLRYSKYYKVGPGTALMYSPGKPRSEATITDSLLHGRGGVIKSYEAIEPRVSAKVQLGVYNSVKVSYNKSSQYISRISNSSIPTPNDVWKLSDSHLKPVISDQIAVGYYQNFDNNSIETSLEVYYKELSNLLEYKNNAQLSMNAALERELINAVGRNYGIELLLRKNSGRITGWIGYTWSRSLMRTTGSHLDEILNNNDFYPSSYDKPHELSVVASYKLSRRVSTSTNFTAATGRPITLPEYQYQSGGQLIVYYSDRNKYRLPTYHRLDLLLTINESLRKNKRWKGSWTFSVLNVYARKNAYTVFYQKDKPATAYNYDIFSFRKLYIIGIPLPTITYNLIF